MAFWMSGTAAAQSGIAAAALNGTVRDASGAVVPGAKITLTSTGTGFEQVTESNATGTTPWSILAQGATSLRCRKKAFLLRRKPSSF